MVRVGYLLASPRRSIIEQSADLPYMLFRTHELQGVVVLAVHHQNPVETLEIVMGDSSGAVSADIDASGGQGALGTGIGGGVREVRMGARGINENAAQYPSFVRRLLE